MAKVTYQPHHHDPDVVTVDGVKFQAYVSVELGPEKAELVKKLAHNPWFTVGDVVKERFERWQVVRDVQAKAKELREEAERLEKEVGI